MYNILFRDVQGPDRVHSGEYADAEQQHQQQWQQQPQQQQKHQQQPNVNSSATRGTNDDGSDVVDRTGFGFGPTKGGHKAPSPYAGGSARPEDLPGTHDAIGKGFSAKDGTVGMALPDATGQGAKA